MTSKTAASSTLGARLSILVPGPRTRTGTDPSGSSGFKSENDFTKQHSLQSKARKAGDFRFGVCPCLLVDSGSWAQLRGGDLLPLFHRTRVGRQKRQRPN